MAKNNEKMWRMIRIVISIGTILVLVAVAYASLRERVQGHSQTLTEHKIKIDAHEKAVVKIVTDIEYIQKDMAKQTIILEEIRKEVKK